MKKNIFFFVFVSICFTANAQSFPDFKPLRYDENYTYLQKDSSKDNWYKRLKYSKLSQNGKYFISYGGDIRFQYFYAKNESWGDDPADHDGYTLSRYLVHADLHAGDHFRTFLQLQSSGVAGRLNSSPVEENPLELHQAFMEYTTSNGAGNILAVRLGRQELSYGSQRLIAVRDGPNNRQSFDAAKVVLTAGKVQLDAFYSHYVTARKGVFDDAFLNKSNRFWGSYAVIRKLPVVQNIDLYYLGVWKKTAIFDEGKATETRHSVGSRIWGNKMNWRYDAEAVYQFGSFRSKSIQAWTASLSTSYEFKNLKFKPEIGLKTELISGDKKDGDNKLQTFNPLFPRGGYFGLAALIGPSNLFDVHPSLSLALSKKLNWNNDVDIFQRYSSNDGIYGPNAQLIFSGKNVSSKYVGSQYSSDLVYQPQPFLYLRAEFTWFKAGDYLKEVSSGKNIVFIGITAQVKF